MGAVTYSCLLECWIYSKHMHQHFTGTFTIATHGQYQSPAGLITTRGMRLMSVLAFRTQQRELQTEPEPGRSRGVDPGLVKDLVESRVREAAALRLVIFLL